jgi:filamentous hemagglutinin
VIRYGTFVPEMNGFVRVIGGPGSAKAAFVGVSREFNRITTFGIRTVEEIAAKAPSLGWIP